MGCHKKRNSPLWWQVPYWAPLTGPCSVAWAPPPRSWRPRPPALPAPPAPSAQPTAKHTRTMMESGLGAARRRGFFVTAGVVLWPGFSWTFCLRILELKCNKIFIKKIINYRLQKLIPGAGAAQKRTAPKSCMESLQEMYASSCIFSPDLIQQDFSKQK